MRIRCGTIHIVVLVALAVGAAAGWFTAGACGNMETANDGRARSPVSPERSEPRKRWLQGCAPDEKAKPRRKALIRSSADAEVQKRILENKISYLEKCIAAVKVSDAKPAEKKRETNAEIIERLKKISNKLERWTAFTRLDDKTQSSLMMGDLKKLFPKEMTIDDELSEELAERLDKMTEIAARRIGILDTVDQSGLDDDERKVHAEYMEFLAECPDVFAGMIDQHDSMTFGEVIGRIKKVVAHYKRGAELVKKEHGMLVTQVVKSFEIPDGDAEELRATLDDVRDVTSSGYFEKKD